MTKINDSDKHELPYYELANKVVRLTEEIHEEINELKSVNASEELIEALSDANKKITYGLFHLGQATGICSRLREEAEQRE